MYLQLFSPHPTVNIIKFLYICEWHYPWILLPIVNLLCTLFYYPIEFEFVNSHLGRMVEWPKCICHFSRPPQSITLKVHNGVVKSKSLIKAIRKRYQVRKYREFGKHATPPSILGGVQVCHCMCVSTDLTATITRTLAAYQTDTHTPTPAEE